MTDSYGINTYTLHTSAYRDPSTGNLSKQGYSCIESLKIHGGPLQPFEYITMELSKKRITSLAPMLVDDIRAGLNIVTIYGFGSTGAQYIVTNCKSKSDTWKVTAYSVAEGIRGYTLNGNVAIGGEISGATNLGGAPTDIIHNIIEPQASSLFSSISGTPNKVHSVVIAYRSDRNTFEGAMEFKAGTSIWYIISLCAMRLGCNVWVSDNVLYVIDLSLKQSDNYSLYVTRGSGATWEFDERSTYYLNTEGDFPYNPTAEQLALMNNVLKTPSPEQEGINLVKNKIEISIKVDPLPDDGVSKLIDGKQVSLAHGSVISGIHASKTQSNPDVWTLEDKTSTLGECKASQEKFGVIQQDISLPEATRDFAQKIADLLATIYCDSEQPITFTMRETSVNQSDSTAVIWSPTFTNNVRINRLIDYSNDLMVSTASNLSPNDPSKNRPAKGMISRWVRNFPEHTTTYTFGEIAPTDMTQNNSIIHTAIGSGGM